MEQQDLHSQIAARPKATRESNSQNSPQQMDAEPRPAATCRSSAQTCTVVSGGYPSADPFVTPSGPQPSAARKWTEYHYHYTYVTPSAFSPIMSGTSRGHPPFSRHRAGGLGQVPDTGDPDSRHDSFLDRRWRHYMRASRDYVRASRDFTGCHLSRDDTMYLVAYAQVNESPDEECLRYIGKRVRASDQQILAWFAYYCQVIRPTTPRVCYGNCMLNSPDFLQGPDIWDVGIANLAMLDASKGTVSRDLLQDNDIRDMGEASLEKVDTIWT